MMPLPTALPWLQRRWARSSNKTLVDATRCWLALRPRLPFCHRCRPVCCGSCGQEHGTTVAKDFYKLSPFTCNLRSIHKCPGSRMNAHNTCRRNHRLSRSYRKKACRHCHCPRRCCRCRCPSDSREVFQMPSTWKRRIHFTDTLQYKTNTPCILISSSF